MAARASQMTDTVFAPLEAVLEPTKSTETHIYSTIYTTSRSLQKLRLFDFQSNHRHAASRADAFVDREIISAHSFMS